MPTRTRLIIYSVLVGALGVLVASGIITPEQSDTLLGAGTGILDLAAAIALVVAARHITPDSWSTLRVAVYVMLAAVLAAATALGWIAPEVMETSLPILDGVLEVVSMVVLAVAAAKVPAEVEEVSA